MHHNIFNYQKGRTMLWLLIIFALCCVYIYLSIKMYPGDMPVYPGRVPILGNISLLLGDSIALWHYIKKLTEYTYNNGHVSVVYAGIMPIYLITDPDDCYKVLTTCLERPGFANKFLKQLLGSNGLLTGPEAIWKQHRKLINPAFNQQVVDSFMGIFNTQSRRLVETLKNHVGKGQFDHHDYLEKTALETISLTMAGVDISNQKEFNYKCLMAFRAVVDGVITRAKNPLYYFDNIYRTSKLKKVEDAHVKITHELTEQVLKKKREVYATEDNNKDGSEKKFKPFLDRLLDFSNKLSDNDIKDEINNIMFAGSQSSSAVLAYTLLILGTYPRILEKCQQEIRDIFGESDRDVEKEDLTNLKYLDAVVKETMRQCPVAPFTGRLITEDIQLKNTVLRKGYPCAILLYGMLNNPALWGKDASEFIPERWLEGRLPENSNALGAFGFGRRNCVAKVYAFTTMKVSLVHILRRYNMTGNFFNMKLKNQVINKPAGGHEISIEFA